MYPVWVMVLLEHCGVALQGKQAVVIGRSNLFGKPMGAQLLAKDATVTMCHSKTPDLSKICRSADVLIAAAGRPSLVRGTWIKPGAAVIDVGINRTQDGVVGHVAFSEAMGVAGALTPVPGGVGPMTIACLLRHTVEARNGRGTRCDPGQRMKTTRFGGPSLSTLARDQVAAVIEEER
jgi:methylenetetrahydrofolate dehydrogenase (NADP+)/methenyltetrahydrofolate cyclohydrolase